MLKRTYEAIKQYLENDAHEALDVAREMNGYDGCYDWCDTYDWDWLCETAAQAGADAVDDLVRAAVYGETYGGQVRYDAYGNLESGELEDLLSDAEDYIVDIMSGLENYIDDAGGVSCINISKELEEVIDNSLTAEYTLKITDIVYDIDDDDVYPYFPKASIMTEEEMEEAKHKISLTLPQELMLTITLEGEEGSFDEDEICDAISDETGWCIVSYNYVVAKEN